MIEFVNQTPFAIYNEEHYSPIYQRSIRQCTLVIPGGGCKIWRQTRGQVCTFCGFPMFARRLILGDGNTNNFDSWMLDAQTYWQMYLRAVSDQKNSDKLAIFNGGSFFVDDELPRSFRTDVLNDFAERPSFRQLMVESRPEYLLEKDICEAKSILGEKDLLIGIGLESADTRVRSKLLKKAMNLAKFESAVSMLKRNEVQSFVYVMLGAPGLSEADALADTLKSIQYLVDMGIDQIAISSTFVAPDTSVEKWFEAGEFRPPWLWSVLEVIDQAKANNWPVTVGGFDDDPMPIAVANNCFKCDEAINNLIDGFRASNTFEKEAIPACDCHDVWKSKLMIPSSWELPGISIETSS